MTRLVAVVLGLILLSGCRKANESVNRGEQKGENAGAPLASVVFIGQSIDTALNLMAPMGNGSPMLEMATRDPDLQMKMWSVGEGVLIAVHSEKDRSIKSLSFYMSDERPKWEAKTFEYEVSQYFPATGEMRIVVPNKAMDSDKK